MFRVHAPIIRSIRCWVAAYGFLHCKEWDNMKCVCSGCTPCYIGVYQCGLWSIVHVCSCGDGGLCSSGFGRGVPPPRTSATHTPATTRRAQTSSPHTNRLLQYSVDRTDKHLYNTAYSQYTHTRTHTSYYLILYSAEKHMLQLNI